MKNFIKARRCRALLLIATSLVSSCGATEQLVLGQKAGRDNHPPDIPYATPQDDAFIIKAFASLTQECFASAGIFNERTRSCDCPASATGVPQSFQAIYRMGPGTGLKRRIFDHYACAEQYQLRPVGNAARFGDLLQSGRGKLLDDLRTARNIGNGRSLLLELDDSISDSQLRDLASYLDSNRPFVQIPSGNQWREMYHIKLFRADESLDRVKRIPYFDFEDTSLIERYGNELFVWSLDDFSHLSATASRPLPELPMVGNNPLMAQLMQGLQAYKTHIEEGSALEIHEDVLVIDQGCHVLCDYKASFRLDGRYYWYEKNYARGSVFRQAFYLGREDGTLDAMTLLFPDRQPSVFITEQRSLSLDGRLEIDSNALDSKGDLLRFDSYPPIPDPAVFASHLQKLKTFASQTAPTTVLVLEEATQLEEPWELDYWIRGPYAADRPATGKSLYGWVQDDDASSNAFSFYFGAMDLNWWTDAGHGREVLHDLMRDIRPGEAYGISTDFTWLLQGHRFNDLVRLAQARIATISAILSVEEEECHRLTAALDADILWIAGAGNEAKENPKFRCPQKIARKDLRIVVAAGSRQELAFFAEFGRDYADIAADPYSYMGRRGSSYAAPKVANVALKIVKAFDQKISNREIRLAILLGADVDIKNRLPLRTGGALNEAFALKAAAVIQGLSLSERQKLQGQQSDRQPLLARIIQASGALNEADALDQARYLLEGGI